MTVAERARTSGLNQPALGLLLLSLVLAVLHHADHVLRVDHSGWPFREVVTPFTFSLLAYPMIFFALFGSRRLFWVRWIFLLAGTGFTLYAHIGIESPQMQFSTWAQGHGFDGHGGEVSNLPAVQSPVLGWVSMAVSMALNVTAVVASVAMLARGLQLRKGAV